MQINEKDISITSRGEKAVEGSTKIALQRFAEQQKTRRMLIIISAILVIVATFVMTYGPADRQTQSTIIGVVLLVFAMGSIGASQFVIKIGSWVIDTTDGSVVRKNTENKTDNRNDNIDDPSTYPEMHDRLRGNTCA